MLYHSDFDIADRVVVFVFHDLHGLDLAKFGKGVT